MLQKVSDYISACMQGTLKTNVFVFYAIRSTGRMQSFKLLAFLGLFIVATVSADNTPRKRRGLCVDTDIFALFSPTNQSLGVKEFKGERREPYVVLSNQFGPDNLDGLPDYHIFCQYLSENGQYFLCPNIGGDWVFENSEKSGKITVWHAHFNNNENQMWMIESVGYGVALQVAGGTNIGKRMQNDGLESEEKVKIVLGEALEDGDPTQTFAMIRLNYETE